MFAHFGELSSRSTSNLLYAESEELGLELLELVSQVWLRPSSSQTESLISIDIHIEWHESRILYEAHLDWSS